MVWDYYKWHGAMLYKSEFSRKWQKKQQNKKRLCYRVSVSENIFPSHIICV